MFGGCDLAQGRLVRGYATPKSWEIGQDNSKMIIFQVWSQRLIFMGKIVMNHGLYPFFCFFPINISVAEIRRVDTVDTVDSLKLLASFSL